MRRIVDSRIHPEQPGWPSDPGKNDEGVNYLRRLKGGHAEHAPVEAKEEANAGVRVELQRRRRPVPTGKSGAKARGCDVREARSFARKAATHACGERLPTSACTAVMWK